MKELLLKLNFMRLILLVFNFCALIFSLHVNSVINFLEVLKTSNLNLEITINLNLNCNVFRLRPLRAHEAVVTSNP